MPRNEDRVYVGIDPGWGGAIAVICGDVTVTPIPENEYDLFQVIHDLINFGDVYRSRPKVILEKVGGFIGTRPGGGAHRNLASGHTMFKFGWCYGAIRMALAATHTIDEDKDVVHVTPQVWQKAIGVACKTKGESQNSFKNRLKDRAIELFPDVKVTLKNADALLLAHYCKMLNEEL